MRKLHVSFTVLLLVAGGFLYYALFVEPAGLAVNQYEISVKNWDKEMDGLRIVMISDIHGGSNFITEDKIRTIVEKANEQDPDLIVLLGDYVSQNQADRSKLKMPMETIAENLKGLKAKYGVFAVGGNHDYWYSDGVVAKELERIGYRVLDNKTAIVETDKGKFCLLGLKDIMKTDSWEKYSKEARAILQNSDTQGAKVIALVHNPDAVVMVTGGLSISDDLVLLLAGHTHGGQVRFPFVGAPVVPSSWGQKYAHGEGVENGVSMFVTSGVGTSILPVRFGVPPEIAVLTVKSR